MQSITLPDFDTLVSLHQQDKEAFEAFRKHLLQQAMEGAPATARAQMKQLLERLDAARSTAASPLEAAAIAFSLMVESMQQLHDTWEHVSFALTELQAGLLIEKIR